MTKNTKKRAKNGRFSPNARLNGLPVLKRATWQHCLYNVWASHNLDISTADDGLDEETLTEDEILSKVKSMAVKSTNTLLSQVKFFQMGQDRSSLAINSLARLRGASVSCNLTVKCTSCEATNSYTEKIHSHQQFRGLLDADIQEKILSKAADKETELTLQDINNAVEALGMAKRDQARLIRGYGDLNRPGPSEDENRRLLLHHLRILLS